MAFSVYTVYILILLFMFENSVDLFDKNSVFSTSIPCSRANRTKLSPSLRHWLKATICGALNTVSVRICVQQTDSFPVIITVVFTSFIPQMLSTKKITIYFDSSKISLLFLLFFPSFLHLRSDCSILCLTLFQRRVERSLSTDNYNVFTTVKFPVNLSALIELESLVNLSQCLSFHRGHVYDFVSIHNDVSNREIVPG